MRKVRLRSLIPEPAISSARSAMQDFVYQSAPMRVVFGAGTLRQLPDELSRLGVIPRLVLATPRQKDLVAGIRR